MAHVSSDDARWSVLVRLNQRALFETRTPQTNWVHIDQHSGHVQIQCLASNLSEAERVQRFHQLVIELMTPEVRVLELDLRRVEIADSKLIAGLILIVRRASGWKLTLVIQNSSFLEELIHLLKVDEIFRQPRVKASAE